MIFYLETYKEFKHKIEKILNEFSKPKRHKTTLENLLYICALTIISPNRNNQTIQFTHTCKRKNIEK
jgi:hypothetical protein